MEIRFYHDPETELPHIYDHGVYKHEVEEVPRGSGDDLPADRGSRMKLGQTIEAARKAQGTTMMAVPTELVPEVRALLARKKRGA